MNDYKYIKNNNNKRELISELKTYNEMLKGKKVQKPT